MGIFDLAVRGGQAYGSRGASEAFKVLPGGGSNEPTPDYSSALGDYQKQRKTAQQDAEVFRNSIPAFSQSISGQQGEEGRVGLAKKLTDIKRGASSRGLLYSGIKQGADQEAATGLAQDLSGKAYATNQALENQAKQMEDTALDAGLKEQQMKQQMNNSAYETALKRRQESQAGMSSLMGGAGNLFGTILGKSG